jgi:hypothetical protein
VLIKPQITISFSWFNKSPRTSFYTAHVSNPGFSTGCNYLPSINLAISAKAVDAGYHVFE